MNNHHIRVIAAGIVAVLVATALFLLLETTSLLIAAYCFVLLAIAAFFIGIGYIATGAKKDYITSTAFPAVIKTYSVLNLLLSVVTVVLEKTDAAAMPVKWFCLVQIVLIAVLVWRLLAMRSGEEMIQQAEQEVKVKTIGWKSLLADVQAILDRTDAASKKDVSAVCEAIRYADPVSAPELAADENAIKENVIRLGMLVDDKNAEDIASLCITLQRQIKDRNTKAKLLK